MPDAEHIKALKFAWEMETEQDGIAMIRPGSMRITTPWYPVILVSQALLDGADEQYVQFSKLDSYHGVLTITVGNGDAVYNLTKHPDGAWVGSLISSRGGRPEPISIPAIN